MILRRSQFIHRIQVAENRFLIVHAVNQTRFPADADVNALLEYFDQARDSDVAAEELAPLLSYSLASIQEALKGLVARSILTEKSPAEELLEVGAVLSPLHGRDPVALLDARRRELQEGAAAYWSVASSLGVGELAIGSQRVDVVLFGDCDIQMETDFLRREASRRDIELHVSATFADDVRFVSDHTHDFIFIGALRTRHTITETGIEDREDHAQYIAHAQRLLTELRARTTAPIAIDNLPEPTVQPFGLSENTTSGHRVRFRRANLALAELVSRFSNVYLVDIAAALAAVGSQRLLDDGHVGFTHFGAPGWMLQRPEYEKAAVHNLFPDDAPLSAFVNGNPYERESILSVAHIDTLVTVLGIDRKKCVILDLDGTLWPGVLAETGAPFAWTPEISGQFSYVGLYFGLHEALLCLKKRGIVLACVSKNDETTVRDLWKYPANYPQSRLLTPEDFVTWRVNWCDKSENIRSIAAELGFSLDAFLFIDDNPVERDRVRQRLPDVEVWGEDPFALRRNLLMDPRLQFPSTTIEAGGRTELVKAQLKRQHLRAEVTDEAEYLASLKIECRFERLSRDSAQLPRVEELLQRTTQFNATGKKLSSTELANLAAQPHASIYVIEVSDKFADHGLVGACVVDGGSILALAMSCRVLGMGVEHMFMTYVIQDQEKRSPTLSGHIIETPRNIPVRNIYKDSGFSEIEPGLWTKVSGAGG